MLSSRILGLKMHFTKKNTFNIKQEMFQKHICPLGAKLKLLLICTKHYEFKTLYKAELNIIK